MPEELGVERAQGERAVHRGAGLRVTVCLVEGPCEEIVAIHITPGADFLLYPSEHVGHPTVVVQEEEAPGAMPLAGLAEDRDLHGVGILGGGACVAEARVCVA